jgi:uncharacterized protein involved in exopolysaccharide biosynthesis
MVFDEQRSRCGGVAAMEHSEASKMIGVLEQQYFEVHRQAKQAEAELTANEGKEAAELRARLQAVEREKCAILGRIAQLEDGLLDEQ